MAQGTTARDPVTWQLRRCLAASTLSSRVGRFGACVVLHQASLGLCSYLSARTCLRAFSMATGAASWRCFAMFTCQFRHVSATFLLAILTSTLPALLRCYDVAAACNFWNSHDNTPSLHTSFLCLTLRGCGFSFALECLHGSSGGLRAGNAALVTPVAIEMLPHSYYWAATGQPLSCPCILLRPVVMLLHVVCHTNLGSGSARRT
jgi:hypothetical protein